MRRIFWLVDPFEKPSAAEEAAVWAMGISERMRIPIQPVHVLSGGALAFSPEIHAAWIMQVALQAEDKIQKLVEQLAIPHVLPPIVLSEIYRSRSEAVHALIEFAKESQAEVFVLERLSGARKTGKIGGFAETLLLKSEIPVLVVGHHRAVKKTVGKKAAKKTGLTSRTPKKILLALDLEGDSTPIIEEVGSWARRMKAQVHLYHAAAPFPLTGYRPAADIYPGDWSGPVAPTTLSAWRGDVEARKKELARLSKILIRKGVECTVEVDSESTRAASGILKSKKRNHADWIAISGRSGRWSALIMGSVSRRVAREADCPVWVVRSFEKAEEKKLEKRGAVGARAA
ncbi:universal stress protein [bacterium]|nr:universal stress protein [bacterium]